MAGFLTREDELFVSTTQAEKERRKKYYEKNRARLLVKAQKNRDKKKAISCAEVMGDVVI